MKRILLTIHGLVQGVFFRTETQARALKLGIIGWVKNNEDGSVSICAQGDSTALEKFTEWCKTGPPDAKVTHIKQTWREPEQSIKGFYIKYN